jgi:hypothetical protein
MKKGENPELSIKEKALVTNLTDPASPTFGNISQSGLRAGLKHRENTFAMLKRPRVRLEIEKALILHHVTVPDRVAAISDIIHNTHVLQESTIYDKKGNIKSLSKQSISNDKARLRAIDILNKMDSTYYKSHSLTSMQVRALSPLIQDYSRRLRAALAADVPVASVGAPRIDPGDLGGEITHKAEEIESMGLERAQDEGLVDGSTSEPSECEQKDTC